jgi:hypothetical protein
MAAAVALEGQRLETLARNRGAVMFISFGGSGAVAGLRWQTVEGLSDRFRLFCLGFLRQRLCALHGHDHLLQFESGRMFLRCASCGYETLGWNVGQHPPRIRSFDETQPLRAPLRSATRYRNAA